MSKFNVGDRVKCTSYGGETEVKENNHVSKEFIVTNSLTVGGYIEGKAVAGLYSVLFVEGEIELVVDEPEFKVFDRVQLKEGANPRVFHSSWCSVPGVLHTNPGEDVDEFPYIIIFDNDDREFLHLRNLSDLEYVSSDVVSNESVRDCDESEYAITVEFTDKTIGQHEGPVNDYTWEIDDNGNLDVYRNGVKVSTYAATKWEYIGSAYYVKDE